MLRRRLDPDIHGSGGFTTIYRVIAMTAAFAFLGLAVNLALSSWYQDRVMPGVVVAGKAIGGLTIPEARSVLQKEAAAYKLKLTISDKHYELTADQIGVTFDTESTVQAAYRAGRGGIYPALHIDPIPMAYKLDRKKLNEFGSKVAAEVGVPPVDAAIVVKSGQPSTVADKDGVTVDRLGLQRLTERDLGFPGGSELQLKTRPVPADIQASQLAPTVDDTKRILGTAISLNYEGKNFSITGNDIGQWLVYEKQVVNSSAKLVPKVDSSRVKDYVQQIANQINVAPVNKKVRVENGVANVTQEGVEGKAVDQDGLTATIIDAVHNSKPLQYGIVVRPVAFKTISSTVVTLDYGNYIEVNLTTQRLWAWQDHHVVLESPLTSGATGAGFGTVTGLFSIYYKTTNTHLNGHPYGYNYDVPVKWWMPFYAGYGLHDAYWRNGVFGGPDYYWNGSHGCVNLPDSTAEFLYNWAPIGTPVWIHT